MPEVRYPIIPEFITVHLGPPGSQAENVTVPFIDYVKNVASSEIYPTWPESALRANIYAIISYALNRVYTEYYPSRGYNFDITNSTQFDQAFVRDREIYENISYIVDDIFNDYIVRQGTIQPLFAAFCNGTTSVCDGLSQWGTVALANEGRTPYSILQNYYGPDINIVENAPVGFTEESYPGVPLRVGDAGNNVKIIQTQLNRIAQNYPAIPKIQNTDGIFTLATEDAVKKFQQIFNLPQTGEVDKSTWYKIKQYYNGVKRLAELASEGISLAEATVPFSEELSEGMSGVPTRTVQYYLSIIAYFNGNLEPVPLTGYFDAATVAAVERFQGFYGLPVTGIVDNATWNTITRIYTETVSSLPAGYQGQNAKLYPGYFLSLGMRNESVTDLQTYLNLIGRNIPEVPEIPVTGYYGEQTQNAVSEFQRLYGIPVSGAVGPVTWYQIAREYDALVEGQQ
ncbi:MAG: peptidoglycan-binding protein [Acutalibacteraceae bacterium]|nr:peptidoglycan-binding protein [Acutalibacteraceae bacterium]